MNSHYVLNLNPEAACEWERCILRNPITGEQPDLKNAIASLLPEGSGSYLVKVSINVEVLETAYSPTQQAIPLVQNPLSVCG